MAVPKWRYAANVRKYYLYTALFGFLTWLAMALGEVPTGIVADTAGRKTSMIIGVCMASMGWRTGSPAARIAEAGRRWG